MQRTEHITFTALMQKVWRFHRLEVTGQEVADWVELLADVPFVAVIPILHRFYVGARL